MRERVSVCVRERERGKNTYICLHYYDYVLFVFIYSYVPLLRIVFYYYC